MFRVWEAAPQSATLGVLGQPQQPARFLAVRDMQDSALDPGCLRQFGENARSPFGGRRPPNGLRLVQRSAMAACSSISCCCG